MIFRNESCSVFNSMQNYNLIRGGFNTCENRFKKRNPAYSISNESNFILATNTRIEFE